MVNDAEWVSEVREWYCSSQGPDRLRRAGEVIDAVTRSPAPTRETPEPVTPRRAPVRLVAGDDRRAAPQPSRGDSGWAERAVGDADDAGRTPLTTD